MYEHERVRLSMKIGDYEIWLIRFNEYECYRLTNGGKWLGDYSTEEKAELEMWRHAKIAPTFYPPPTERSATDEQ